MPASLFSMTLASCEYKVMSFNVSIDNPPLQLFTEMVC